MKATDSTLNVGATWQIEMTSLECAHEGFCMWARERIWLLSICSWSCLRGILLGCSSLSRREGNFRKEHRWLWSIQSLRWPLNQIVDVRKVIEVYEDCSNRDRENENAGYEKWISAWDKYYPVFLLGTRELMLKLCSRKGFVTRGWQEYLSIFILTIKPVPLPPQKWMRKRSKETGVGHLLCASWHQF